MVALLGITGRMGSGKTTASQVLVDRGWINIKMAGPLKDMARAIGLTDRHIEGDLKEVPCDLLCGRTPRHAMQTLGTEWGRDMIAPHVWTNIARTRIVDAMASGLSVVVDDIRFQNEADLIRDLGGMVLRIVRPDIAMQSHQSEADLPADMIHVNNGTERELIGFVRYVFLCDGVIV